MVNIVYGCCIIAMILLLIQIFMFTSFKIPSDSMEPSLLAGDYIWVDKCSKGARLFNVLDAIDKKPVIVCLVGEVLREMIYWCSTFLIQIAGIALHLM